MGNVHLIHYIPDRLWRWNPSLLYLNSLGCRHTVVEGHFDLYGEHFRKHWLRLQLGCGIFSIPHLMMRYDEAALEQKRDAAPLRLISWLTFGLPTWLQDIVEALMIHYGHQCPESADNINAFLQEHVPTCPTLESPDVIRDHIVDRISEWNKEWQPESLLNLFEGFLKRMPLHRLVHFLDMILPQLTPMHTRWDDPRKSLLCCHFFPIARPDQVAMVPLQYLFTSRAHIYMVRIGWERQPLLLFSDVHRIGLESFVHFQIPNSGSVTKHNVQMGFPEGHSVLMYFSQNEIAYQAVLVSMSSAPSKGKRGEHAMWKHAQPVSTDFAWLPQDVAQIFRAMALRQDQTRQYGAFSEIQLGFNQSFQAWLNIQGFYYLGETRSVEEFGIFSQMPAERLCLGCGVQSDDTFTPRRHRTEVNSSKPLYN